MPPANTVPPGESEVDGKDMGGYVRAKLGSPPALGEEQACTGTGTFGIDTASFVAHVLNRRTPGDPKRAASPVHKKRCVPVT